MTAAPHPALAGYLLALADDELILGHRDSEWCGHAPILEEDIAFANLAQDEMGHAGLWYRLRQELTGDTPDQLVFFRSAAEYRCVQMVELPKGDWAFSMLRQYLFDAAEAARLAGLVESQYAPLAETAAKIRTEEIYHTRHTRAWVMRLGLGTEESHRRMQTALDELWPYALQLFVPVPGEAALANLGLVPLAGPVQQTWEAQVESLLGAAQLTLPAKQPPIATSRETHSHHLAPLLQELQAVARLEGPEVVW